MRKIHSLYLSTISLILLFFAISSCSTGNNSNSNNTALSEASNIVGSKSDSTSELETIKTPNIADTINNIDTETDEQMNEGNRVYFTIPAPEEVLSYVTQGGFAFNPALMNPITNQKKYVDSRSKSLNLGCYFSDVAYTAVFSQPARSAEYMKTIEEIGVEISVFSNSDKHIRKRMSSNISNVDSVSLISKEAYEIIVDYLFNTNRQKTYALLCAGAYVESMYLALNYADGFQDFSASMVKKIIEQKLLFDDIYGIMASIKGDPDIDITLKELKPIKESLDRLGFSVSNPTSGENKQGELLIKSDNKYEYTEGSFTTFRTEIGILRNNWTGN